MLSEGAVIGVGIVCLEHEGEVVLVYTQGWRAQHAIDGMFQ